MRATAVIGGAWGLLAVLAAVGAARGQEPGAASAPTPKAAAARPGADPAGVARAVDDLVAALRKYPARPSAAAGAVGLFLIDADGGEAVRIAGEPDPWLNHCGSPAWSHDGRRIVFEAAMAGQVNGFPLPIARLKALDVAGGRPEVRDLGPGSTPDVSPTDDRIVFQINRGSQVGAQPGVWLMRADGSGRRLLGGSGRPKWSPAGNQFLIADANPRGQAMVMDANPEKSGFIRLPDQRIIGPPSWAGPGTIVAVVGPGRGDSIALIDVSDPDQARVQEVLWKKERGPDVWPAHPVYSPATRRCVFVGNEPGVGQALYAFEHGRSDPPRRLEKEGADQFLQDLAFSPDGRFLVFASDRRPVRPQRPSVDAPALSGITIDGDLKDWPAAIPRYPIHNMHAFPNSTGPGHREHAFLSTSPDLSAAFSVGYDPKEQLIYVAVIVRDDRLVVGKTSPWDTDAVEIYVDGLRSDTVRGFPQDPNWGDNSDAGEFPALQYIGLPADKGPVYGVRKSAGVERSGDDNPILSLGDIKKTRTRMAFRREGDVTTYEWAVQAFDHYPDRPTRLLPGVAIGFDVAVSDKDRPAQTPQGANDPEEDWQAWVCWGPPWRALKHLDAGSLGEIVLGRAPSP